MKLFFIFILFLVSFNFSIGQSGFPAPSSISYIHTSSFDITVDQNKNMAMSIINNNSVDHLLDTIPIKRSKGPIIGYCGNGPIPKCGNEVNYKKDNSTKPKIIFGLAMAGFIYAITR